MKMRIRRRLIAKGKMVVYGIDFAQRRLRFYITRPAFTRRKKGG